MNPKAGKMFGVKVTLPVCPKCGKKAVDPKMHACLSCDWVDPTIWTDLTTTDSAPATSPDPDIVLPTPN